MRRVTHTSRTVRALAITLAAALLAAALPLTALASNWNP
jgi:hypothetical protein